MSPHIESCPFLRLIVHLVHAHLFFAFLHGHPRCEHILAIVSNAAVEAEFLKSPVKMVCREVVAARVWGGGREWCLQTSRCALSLVHGGGSSRRLLSSSAPLVPHTMHCSISQEGRAHGKGSSYQRFLDSV